uniref:Uncharacterized protein n=1 Tax=Siphoviridae sp. ctEFi15 TaxID=2826204 RepID=A0A8S5NDM2_9CAUD|nr:MAG TPA: hypothetical protein [Siphoviridae sp. ctEFi15]
MGGFVFISNDHLRLLLIQRCDARFLLFWMTTRSRFLESHFVLNCKVIITYS